MIVSSALAALIAQRTVRVATLVFFDFASAPLRVWSGFGALQAGGYTWSGLGELGSISDVEIPLNGSAPTVTFTLAGVAPELVGPALASRDEVFDRLVQVFFQHFDETWAPVDAPLCVYSGRMDLMRVKAPDARTRVVEVTAEWEFTTRATPAFGYLSDADQKARAPGDRGAEFVASMADKTVVFPR